MTILYSIILMTSYIALIFGGIVLINRVQCHIDVNTQIAAGNKLYCRVDVVDVDTGELILKGLDYFEIHDYEERKGAVKELQKTRVYKREDYVCGRACELFFWVTGRVGKIKYKVTAAGRRAGIKL